MIRIGARPLQKFFALSRTAHALLDIAAPAFCALLWLGRFPDARTTALSLFTAFAAYTAVYALNDLIGLKDDQEKFTVGEVNQGYSMDASAGRHPLAQGELDVPGAVAWTFLWFSAAVAGSLVLNPTIVPVLVGAAAIEVFYCRLLKVTHLRALLSGLVKTSGSVAAILVVDPAPQAGKLILVIAWLFFWEIGGQNVPSDWNDTVEDARVNAKTLPLRFGFRDAGRVILAALTISVLLSAFLPFISPAALGTPFLALALAAGFLLLLRPALRLVRNPTQSRLAASLFESASYYPLAMLASIVILLVPSGLNLR